MFKVDFKSKDEWYFAAVFESEREAVAFATKAIYFNPSVDNARINEVKEVVNN